MLLKEKSLAPDRVLNCEILHMRFYFILGYLNKLWPLATAKL